MKNTLIITIGNRDMQVPKSSTLPVAYYDFFEKGGADTGSNLIVKKTGGTFCNNSEALLEAYSEVAPLVSFPMVDTCLSQVSQRPDLVVVVATRQSPLDSQDCHYVALFLQRWLEEKGYNTDYYPLECAPVDFPELVNVFSGLYEAFRDTRLYVGNSGGTPDMRAASYAAGFFRGIEFITIQAPRAGAQTGTVNVRNYIAQERLVLRHVVGNMLQGFDYGGILQLPLHDEFITQLAGYALARLSLDFEQANALTVGMEGGGELLLAPDMSIREKEREVWISAKIKFRQGAWGDYLWRLFLMHDNWWIPLIESETDHAVVFNARSEFKEWHDLIDAKPGLRNYLLSKKIGKSPLDFSKPGSKAYECIVEFFAQEDAFMSRPGMGVLYDIDRIISSSLRELRNGIAHNYRGISRMDIERSLQEKSSVTIEQFHRKVAEHTGVEDAGYGIYDIINRSIMAQLV